MSVARPTGAGPPDRPRDLGAPQLLAAARLFLNRPELTTEPVWPRTCAFLARQAIEQAVGDFWATRHPEMTACPMRSQLVCLRGFVPSKVATHTAHLWWVLSRACHHHAYELAPTARELGSWLDDADAVIAGLADTAASV
jgi:hypothetical protein